jgi:hypothetical protein
MKKSIIVLSLLFISVSAKAEVWIDVNDMSKVKWQISPTGIVYLRNLNEFNPQALPCCYNYSIDTTTEGGKALWSAVLTKMSTSGRLILGVKNFSAAGPITYAGIW